MPWSYIPKIAGFNSRLRYQTTMKVIFLDIDGVLNTTKSLKEARLHKIGIGSFWNWEKRCLFNLLHITDAVPEAQIVLSSDWRLFDDASDSVWVGLRRAGLNPPIDKTPDMTRRFDHVCRGDEIQAWLDQHEDVTHFVILDDWEKVLPEQEDHLVRTDEKLGLTWADAEKAIEILSL